VDRLRAEVEELRRQIGHESAAYAELEERLADVSGIRDQLRESRTRILIARVIAEDASPMRDTLLITRGSTEGVRVGQWVVAGKSAATTAGQSGRELLGREWLIGRVSEVQPYRSRVLLATDPSFPKAADQKLTRVRLARVLADGTWQLADGESLLIGAGRGHMRVEQAVRDYFAEGYRIVVAPASKDLPLAMTLGRVESSSPVVEAPLMFNLDVRPWGDAIRLGHVYLICPAE
jgi:cell shape-determining protein MreC